MNLKRGVRQLLAIALAELSLATLAVAGDQPRLPETGVELPVAQREAWRKVIGWPPECEEAFAATNGSGGGGVIFYDLGGRHRLAEIACARGAYQGSFVFASIEPADKKLESRLLSFPLFESTDGSKFQRKESSEVWGTVEFHAGTRALSVLNRFRGPGDCGTYIVYRFVDGKPVIEKARGKARCDGRGAGHPERWPRIQ